MPDILPFGYELNTSLLDIHLQGGFELASVGELDFLINEWCSGFQQVHFGLAQFRIADGVLPFDTADGNTRDFIGLAVNAHKRWGNLSRTLVHQVCNTSHISRFTEVLRILGTELVALELLFQIGFFLNEVGNKADTAVLLQLERQTGCRLELLVTESRCYRYQVGLAVVEHLLQVA